MSRVVLNRNLVRELQRDPRVRELVQEKTDDVEREARRASPLGSDFVGYYGRFAKRVTGTTGTVGNTDIAAHLVEFGSANNPAYAPLRRGVSSAGLRFADDGRDPGGPSYY